MKEEGISWHVYDADISKAFRQIKVLVEQGKFMFERNPQMTEAEYVALMKTSLVSYCETNSLNPDDFLNNPAIPLIPDSNGGSYETYLGFCLIPYDIHRINFFLDYQKENYKGSGDFINLVEYIVYDYVRWNSAFDLDARLQKIAEWISNKRLNENVIEKEGIDPGIKLMDKPFNPALVNIDTKTPSLDTLIKRMAQSEPEIEMNTENYFQRNPDLWDDGKQSRLIESILIRFPLPAFYFDGTNKNKWLVVDGLQRLSSIKNFVINKTLKLVNLEFLTHLAGLGYDDFDRDLQRIIEETQIVTYIINPGTPDDVKFNIFKRINTGGLVLEAQEIRHALNQGDPARFIAELAEIEEFIHATCNSIRSERMLDRDFANRFLAFYHFGYENYTPDLDTFMSKAMAAINKMTKADRAKCKQDFTESMRLNYAVFGINAFRKIEAGQERRKPLNKALFDVFSVLFARLNKEEREKIIVVKEQVVDGLIDLIENDQDFFASITSSTSDKGRVHIRFSKVEELINFVLNNLV
jgi:hypothetical protein